MCIDPITNKIAYPVQQWIFCLGIFFETHVRVVQKAALHDTLNNVLNGSCLLGSFVMPYEVVLPQICRTALGLV